MTKETKEKAKDLVTELIEMKDEKELVQLKFRRKIFEAQKKLKGAAKDATANMGKFKYDYITTESLMRLVKEALAESNLLFETSTKSVKSLGLHGSQYITEVEVEFTISDLDSLFASTSVYFGHGASVDDKGLPKAYTGAVKSYFRQYFLIPIGEHDDPEFTGYVEHEPRAVNGSAREVEFVPTGDGNPWLWTLESGPLAGEKLFQIENDILRKIVGSDKASSNDRGYAKAALNNPTGRKLAEDPKGVIDSAEKILGAVKVGTADMVIKQIPLSEDNLPNW